MQRTIILLEIAFSFWEYDIVSTGKNSKLYSRWKRTFGLIAQNGIIIDFFGDILRSGTCIPVESVFVSEKNKGEKYRRK